jgi:L-asparaginase
MMKKILLLFCGGTITMKKNEEGALAGHYTADDLLRWEPRIKEVADIDVKLADDLDSTNMNHKHWEKLVDLIGKNYHKYDGFLITQGTNTLAYTSSALSFALQGIGKPVILTGAQIPGAVINTDARNNVTNSLRVASLDLSGVYVVFGSKIMLGCRTKKVSESQLDAFKSFQDADFGEIRIGIKINSKKYPKRHKNKFKPQNGFEDNIISLTCIPGMQSRYVERLIDSGIKGLILRGYGAGDIPYDLLPALDLAKKKKVPVVITTQCPTATTIMNTNDPGLQALKAGAIETYDMSMESMSTKLMWLLKQGVAYKKIRELMHKNMVGEINTDVGNFLY